MILGLCLPALLVAQAPTDSLYFHLVATYLQQHPGPYLAVDTAIPSLPLPALWLDDSATVSLWIGSPRVAFERLAKKSYLRHLQLSLRPDSSRAGQLMQVRDTLDLAALRRVREEAPPPLRGENPTAAARWLRPALIISGSTAAILALFLIRTPL
ncbi:MAG: hypothetical protein D6722_02235 [Bacteroidetes bacterium]|nr:MAG: hypothetical protein D6722_02235 [Bacteroidota bacterium]